MIVTGGENVYSVEVENAIASHPDVAQVAVIGIPDEKWGECVHAIVVPREGTHPTEADIIAHARESIAGYKVPKSVEIRTEPLPLSGALKVLKKDLRAPYWAGHERAVNYAPGGRARERAAGRCSGARLVRGDRRVRSGRGRDAGGARTPARVPTARGPSTSHDHVSPTNSASLGRNADAFEHRVVHPAMRLAGADPCRRHDDVDGAGEARGFDRLFEVPVPVGADRERDTAVAELGEHTDRVVVGAHAAGARRSRALAR